MTHLSKPNAVYIGLTKFRIIPKLLFWNKTFKVWSRFVSVVCKISVVVVVSPPGRERVDRELREKEKIRSDLEKAEKLKAQLATEVDEHHSAIEHTNNLNLR